MDFWFDIIEDTLMDGIKTLPFLFLAYLLMEFLERKTEDKSRELTEKAGKVGPLLGGLFGVLPQCGFSSAATNLYAGRVISLGTLMAVYLSTSDEMLPLMLSKGVGIGAILPILVLKAMIAIVWGFIIDAIYRLLHKKDELCIEELCEREHCHCDEEEGSIFKSALIHTLNIFIYILVLTLILNSVIGLIGEEPIRQFLSGRFPLGHFLSGLIGLIPNCAASVLITELYLQGVISFGMMMSGLLVGAGIGLLILYRVNNHLAQNIKITVLLYLLGVGSGLLIELLNMSF